MLGFSTQHPTVSCGTERPHLPPLGPAGVTNPPLGWPIVTKPRFRPSVSTAKSRYFNNLRLPHQTHTQAVVRRLLNFNRTSESFYRRKRAQYQAEYQALRAKEKAKFQEQEQNYRRNPPQDAVSNFGKPFIRLVLNTYYQDRITLSDVSSYLGLRVRHVPKIEQTVGLG